MAVDVLPKFQAFLRAKKIVPDKQIQFYALWAAKFLSFQNRNSFTKPDIARDQFLAWLRETQNIEDWQLRQAEKAVLLYTDSFVATDELGLQPASVKRPQAKACDCLTAEKRIREAIRLRHYSYRTEKTYIDWCRRFYAWLAETGCRSTPVVNSSHIRDYLSYLAIHKKVSSSTQNQAFNALLNRETVSRAEARRRRG